MITNFFAAHSEHVQQLLPQTHAARQQKTVDRVLLKGYCPVTWSWCRPSVAKAQLASVDDEEEEEERCAQKLPWQGSPLGSPAYCHIRNNFDAIFWGPAPTLSSFCALRDPNVIGRFLKECFAHRNTLLTI